MNILLLIVIFILQIGFGITMSGYGRNKGVKQAVEALQKILEEREEVTIKLSMEESRPLRLLLLSSSLIQEVIKNVYESSL